jgi:acyl-CoA reductase-like NAD-dependent aldehyde dehydrogenase
MELVRSGHVDAVEDDWMACRDVFTGERLGEARRMSAQDVRDTVAQTRAAIPSWRNTSHADRRRVLATLLDEIVTAQDELCRLAVHESGKTMIQASLGDILPACSSLWEALRRPSHRSWRGSSERPPNLVAIMTSPRFPLQSIVVPVASALVEGHGAIVKLSEHASWSGQMYVEIVHNVLRHHGHDPRVVASITGGPRTVAALIDAKLERIVGGGPDATARDILTRAARSLTSVTWQRHGNEVMIVREDAELEGTVNAAVLAAYTPLPPPLVAAERILVHARSYDAFVETAKQRVVALRQGMPLDEVVDCGAVAPCVGVEHVAALVDDACRCGATVLVGGRRDRAFARTHYPPTLLVGVPPHARIAREPTFGPVMTVMRVESDDEAVELANGAPTGAGVSIFGRSGRKARALAQRLRASTIRINDTGIAQSLGTRSGMSVLRAVSPYPAGPRTYAILESLLRLRFGPGVRARLRAAAELGRSTRSRWTV